jgi:hypothetical protein
VNEGVAGSRAFEVTEREESSKALVDRLGLVDQPFTKKLLHVGPGSCWGGCVQGTHEIAVVVMVLKRQGCSGVVFVAVAPPRHPRNCKNLLLPLLQATCKEYDALIFFPRLCIKLLINIKNLSFLS